MRRRSRTIYIESQYFTNDMLGGALAARLSEPDGPEVLVVTPKDCHGWLERKTMGAFRDGVFRQLIAADTHRRLRLVYPAASRAQDVPTFVHSKVMIVDDALVRIGSANFSRRSMGVDTECDLAVDAAGDSRVRAGIRRIRDRLLAEHLGLPVDAVARGIERARSLRALIDAREHAEHTLVRIDVVAANETAAAGGAAGGRRSGRADTVRLVGRSTGAASRRDEPAQPLRFWIPAIVLVVAFASTSSALVRRPEFDAVRDALTAMPDLPATLWIGVGAFVLANLALIPLELVAIAAGVLFGALRGSLVALLGSLVAAAIGYVAGRAIGPAGLTRWMSRRSYRSARQLGAQGVVGVIVLRLASVASAGSVHLLCGAGRVPFAAYMAGTVIGLTPAIAALSGLGGLLRHTLLHPSVSNGAITIGAAVLLIGVAAGLRTFLLDSSVCAISLPPSRPGGVRLMPADRPRLRVATYNVHACVGTDGRHDPDRVASVIGELDADIVALQEFTYPASVALETRQPVVLTTLDRYECALGPDAPDCDALLRQRAVHAASDCRRASHRPVDGAPGAARRAGGDGSRSAARRCTCSPPISAFAYANGDFRCGRS